MYDIQHCFICRPSDSTVSEDTGIETRTVATTALAVRRSNHTTIDLIHCVFALKIEIPYNLFGNFFYSRENLEFLLQKHKEFRGIRQILL
jgi:hypothetical protein